LPADAKSRLLGGRFRQLELMNADPGPSQKFSAMLPVSVSGRRSAPRRVMIAFCAARRAEEARDEPVCTRWRSVPPPKCE
jgi:hypothetical protein